MHNEHGRVWGNCVDLIERGHPALGELKFRPPADHPDPLRGGVRAACSFSIRKASASEGTPSQRNSKL